MSALPALIGARIRRIDAPRAGLLCVGMFGRELRGTLLFSFAERHAGVGWLDTRPHGDAASSFVLKLRKELEGARVEALRSDHAATLVLELRRGDQTSELRCDLRAATIGVLRGDSVVCELQLPPAYSAARATFTWPESLEELIERGPALLADAAADAISDQRRALDKLIATAHKRLARRLDALAQDSARAEQAAPLRARAQLVLAEQHRIRRGQTTVTLLDYTLDPPAETEIALDPALTLQQQIEGWFKQAKRFERGAELARERTRATHAELAQLAELRRQLTAADPDALLEIAQRARQLGVRGVPAPGGVPKPETVKRHKPYRELRGHGDRPILVGKGAADNDTLTREYARPQDLWLHARNVTGAHVVVPLERNETCPQELLLDAAHLAAHFSAARGESIVDVSYTPKRFLRKSKHSPPGQVSLDREKVLTLHVDTQRLNKLLATEVQF
jgi:predicted ribosome quality control (RQC) complex YloA/Tae2 family protein